MPNHVRNIVTMKGISRLPLFKLEINEETGEETVCFDFNKIIPMPESLNITRGSITNESIIYYLTDRCTKSLRSISEENKALIEKKFVFGMRGANELFQRVLEETSTASEKNKDNLFRIGQTCVENQKKYGATDWYDWRIDNWDTKWNAYDNEQPDEDTVIFSTAWSSPQKVIEKLAEMYPNATIEHRWADEDIGNNTGYALYEGGEQKEICWFDDRESNEAIENYIECWKESQCFYKDEDGDWQHYNCDSCHGCD